MAAVIEAAAAVAGIGIVACSLWGCRAELKSGALIQILKEWEMDAVEVHALFPAGLNHFSRC